MVLVLPSSCWTLHFGPQCMSVKRDAVFVVKSSIVTKRTKRIIVKDILPILRKICHRYSIPHKQFAYLFQSSSCNPPLWTAAVKLEDTVEHREVHTQVLYDIGLLWSERIHVSVTSIPALPSKEQLGEHCSWCLHSHLPKGKLTLPWEALCCSLFCHQKQSTKIWCAAQRWSSRKKCQSAQKERCSSKWISSKKRDAPVNESAQKREMLQ